MTISKIIEDHMPVTDADVAGERPVGCSCGFKTEFHGSDEVGLDRSEQFAAHLSAVIALELGFLAQAPAGSSPPLEASIQVQICTSENRGDHAASIRLPATVNPDETVLAFVQRMLQHPGSGGPSWKAPLQPGDWIELRWIGDPPAAAPDPLEF